MFFYTKNIIFSLRIFFYTKIIIFSMGMGIYCRLSAFFMPLFSFFSSFRSWPRHVNLETRPLRAKTEMRPRPIKLGLETRPGLETSITDCYWCSMQQTRIFSCVLFHTPFLHCPLKSQLKPFCPFFFFFWQLSANVLHSSTVLAYTQQGVGSCQSSQR